MERQESELDLLHVGYRQQRPRDARVTEYTKDIDPDHRSLFFSLRRRRFLSFPPMLCDLFRFSIDRRDSDAITDTLTFDGFSKY